jgi:3-hydroxyisobutyrate dehydrogenase
MDKPRIAFFGLGTMGGGMARRLLGAGYPLSVYNRSREKAEPFAEGGAVIAATPREAAAGSEIVISMVADDQASRGLWLGLDGALAGAKPGTILIESSTLSVGWIRELAESAGAAGCELLDAPVTGSRPQAAAGELSFLVGGSGTALENVRPVLEAMGKAIVHLGPTGSGSLLKLINNFLCGVQAASLAEAMAMVERGGLNRDAAMTILTNGAPGSPLIKTLSARMTGHDYKPPYFMLRLMSKDLAYAAAEGGAHGIESMTATAALKVFQNAVAHGEGDLDLSAVVEQFRTHEGLKL